MNPTLRPDRSVNPWATLANGSRPKGNTRATAASSRDNASPGERAARSGRRGRSSPPPEKGNSVKHQTNTETAAAKPTMALPEGYMRKKDGIFFHPKGEGTTPFFVCREFEILAKTRDDFGNAWGLWLNWSDSDDREHNWAMPMSMLAGDGAEIRATMLDGGFQIATASPGRTKFIELLANTAVKGRARSVSKVGWNDYAFVFPGKTIGDTPENRVLYQGSDALDHAYRISGSVDQWQGTVARYGLGNSRLAFALSAAFVGPLLTLLGEESGGFNLRGPSSIGKSTALIAAASVWGPPSFVRQWRATSNGLEGICVQHNETFLGLDELAQLDPREAGIAAYLIANGMGKARAGRSGTLRSPTKWHVMFLSSGEISLADLAGRDARGAKRSAAGQEIRILDFEADAGAGLGLFENLHDAPSAEAFARRIKEGVATTHGVAGPAFVEGIIANRDTMAAKAKSAINEFVAEHAPVGADGQVLRAARRFGLVAAAGELAAEVGVLPWPKGEATYACTIVFEQWLNGRGGTGAAEDREAIAKVRGFLEMHGGSRFEPYDQDENAQRIINRAGFWRDSENGREYLFLKEAWKNEVCAGMDSSRVAKVLGDRGLLRRDSQGKNSISVTLPGLGKTRCYVITADIFDGDAHM